MNTQEITIKVIDPTFMVSWKAYTEKPTKENVSTKYDRYTMSIQSLANLLHSGHTITNAAGLHCDTTPTKEQFQFGNLLCLDIDGTDLDRYDIEGGLGEEKLTPNILYESFSSQTAKYNGQKAWHLIYAWPQQLTANQFKYVARTIATKVSNKLGVEIDSHNLNPTQMIFGTNKSVYTLNPTRAKFTELIGMTSDEIPNIEVETNTIKPTHKVVTNKKKVEVSEIKLDLDNYKYFTSTKDVYDMSNLDEHTPVAKVDEYYEIKPRMWKNGTIHKYNNGEGRRNKLYTYALIRRLIKSEVTKEELYYCATVDLNRFCYNTKEDYITTKDLMSIVHYVMTVEINDELKKKFNTNRQTIVNDKFCENYGVSRKAASNMGRKLIKDNEIAKYFDEEKTIKENLQILKDNGVKVGKSKLYEYYNEYVRKPLPEKDPEKDGELITKDNLEEGRFYPSKVLKKVTAENPKKLEVKFAMKHCQRKWYGKYRAGYILYPLGTEIEIKKRKKNTLSGTKQVKTTENSPDRVQLVDWVEPVNVKEPSVEVKVATPTIAVKTSVGTDCELPWDNEPIQQKKTEDPWELELLNIAERYL